ncbi:MAG: hypothetical protein ACXV3A_10755 [Kineosporiaceae bacterium]
MNITAPAARPTRSELTVSPAGRWTSIAGAAYVAAWISGLLVVPSAPAPTGPADLLHDFYVSDGPAIAVQALLVHGLAGVALAVLAAALPLAAGVGGRVAVVVRSFGVAAAAVSLVQVGLTLAAVLGVLTAAPDTTRSLVHAVDLADAVKLVLLAGFVTAATSLAARAGLAPRWLRILAGVLVVLLPLGGAAFVAANDVLGLLLVASLPLLLVWAGAVAYLVGRHA